MKYLALGDSYTIGEGVAEDGRWPVVLARALRGEGIALDDPRIIERNALTAQRPRQHHRPAPVLRNALANRVAVPKRQVLHVFMQLRSSF